MVSRIAIKRGNPVCGQYVNVSDPSTNEAVKLNKAAILGPWLTGNGRITLDTISACMEMLPPLAPASFSVYTKDILESIDKDAESGIVEAANHLHRLVGKPIDEVIGVIVTVDGT